MPDSNITKAKSHAAPTHKNHVDLQSNARKVSIELLNARLADAIDTALILKQAHWNIKGPQFIGVHELLDTLRTQVDDLVDKFAERVAALGGTAFGTLQTVSAATSLPPYPTDIYTIKDHVVALVERFGLLANAVRKNIDDTDEAGDAGTSDLFTEASRAFDKSLWFLEAHIQEPNGF
ncbi:DNA starvation/stationary phase protection protein Dps [Granulibacter bethesdensis]|uniref:Non-specific DNA-binding protein Dps n=1 Tax=Granulibacter bethesdensis (strain ATCC BAA-1260 / CGDNIH1) TaxID=391165 RepID=Q0BUB9_GRABC|nr:DNA starvation/stationary phase protection protein Dps [Granulibacter bethesdensis]ABI61583.1 Non-specific DNA-binding protein Dps [Granulibacter bethesdensis CGDNIH1]AHJ67721.1 Non-specific DNA-binding protein Dps [Granulibacter bethesdensis]APH51384.1 Non-specific DNA-binding protein Dps [Granulibacter bethesdensis]APH64077.1 Non-specific DNA-binding protein Dps [Granulibacter bethesdensis]